MKNSIILNLEDQVLKNAQDIANYIKKDKIIADYGIHVQGQVQTEDDIPEREYEYGDAWLVGEQEPYDVYIYTRGEPDGFLNIGPIAIQGEQGIQGIQGERGETGLSTSWYTGSDFPEAGSQWVSGDMYLRTTTSDVYRYDGTAWDLVTNIKGVQGIQGPQGPIGLTGPEGPQGEKGNTGDVGGFINIHGILANTASLPDPTALQNLTIAYLIGEASPYDLYIQVGSTSEDAIWTNMGVLNVATYITVNGDFQNVWDADTKVDKVTNHNAYDRVYGIDPSGEQTTFQVSPDVQYSFIPMRDETGNIAVPATPGSNNSAASKQYVDQKAGISMDLLYQGSSSIPASFSPGYTNLSGFSYGKYRFLVIYYWQTYSSGGSISSLVKGQVVPLPTTSTYQMNYKIRLTVPFSAGYANDGIFYREGELQQTKIYWGAGYNRKFSDITTRSTDNSVIMPYQIYGIK